MNFFGFGFGDGRQQGHGAVAAAAPAAPGAFSRAFRVLSMAFSENTEHHRLENGDKVVLPQSAMHTLSRLNVQYPIVFRAETADGTRHIYCGVMEFTAPEGTVYMPYWMMQNLRIDNSDLVQLQNASLSKGTFVQFQPHEYEFTQLANPKAVLERAMRAYTVLTQGTTIKIQHADRDYLIDVVETRPGDAVSVIETDLNVDFAPPKDIAIHEAKWKKEAEAKAKKEQESSHEEDDAVAKKQAYFSKFSGGHRLSGNTVGTPIDATTAQKKKPTLQRTTDLRAVHRRAPAGKSATRTEVVGKIRYHYRDGKVVRRERIAESEALGLSSGWGESNPGSATAAPVKASKRGLPLGRRAAASARKTAATTSQPKKDWRQSSGYSLK
ncbi:MAG: hypothetical protein MHM6MM_000553 [Cercozoa sp. M6MM]